MTDWRGREAAPVPLYFIFFQKMKSQTSRDEIIKQKTYAEKFATKKPLRATFLRLEKCPFPFF